MNKVFITGMIVDSPIYRMENGSIPHLFFRICVRHKTRAGETRGECYRISAWHNTALWGHGKLQYGQLIGVEGYLTQRTYSHNEKQQTSIEIIAEKFLPMRQIFAEETVAE